VNVLWLMRHAAYLRNYELPIRALLAEGHTIHVGFTRGQSVASQTVAERLRAESPGFTAEPMPTRADRWVKPLRLTRESINYLRYLHPRYAESPVLAGRSRVQVPAPQARLLEALARGRPIAIGTLTKALRVVERCAPPSRALAAVIRDKRPDVVLVSSVVDFRCAQTDYVKTAKALGVPVGLLVASWDNLTNKGLIHVEPDLVVVWNDFQRREAIELHGIAPARIAVTGAQLYDQWFEARPSTSRGQFCERVGLDPDRPFVVYLCSSASISQEREPDFVRSWIAALRGSGHGLLERLGVLVRPHPTNAAEWQRVDLVEFSNATIWPRGGRIPLDGESKAEYFDTLWHGAAVVGLNTSGLIEAAIVGRTVYTVTPPDFAGTQGGTLHFRYLLPEHGGPLRVAPDLDTHVKTLAQGLELDTRGDAHRRWLGEFVRPHGLDRPATPFVVDAIRRLARMAPSPVSAPAR
jgi:hypothetical protein